MKAHIRNKILEIYDTLDDDYISTERLLQMVADAANAELGSNLDVSHVVDALSWWQQQKEGRE